MREVVFDIEVYPEFWCIVYEYNSIYTTIRSDDINYKDKLKVMGKDAVLIGFNVKGYDMRILHAITQDCDPYQVYDVSKAIFNDLDNTFNNYYFWNKFKFSDLFDDWKFGSLKAFESNIGMSIEECPVPFDKINLNENEKQSIIDYCIHDVEATVELLKYRRDYIDSKLKLGELYKIPLDTSYKSTNAKLSALALKADKNKKVSMSSTYNIPNRVEKYVNEYIPSNILDIFKEIKYKDLDESTENTIVELFDNKITYGVGGIHSTYKDTIVVRSNSKYVLRNIDATSYYPNLIIHFDYMSRKTNHPYLYTEMYNLRVKYKKMMKEEYKLNGKTDKYYEYYQIQAALKLVLNTVYGAMKNKYNALYDPEMASSVCYLGQILLTALANEIYQKLDAKIIQTNTDGILIYVNREQLDLVDSIVKKWETITEIPMEQDDIKVFFQRDVNNYIEVDINNELKLKGKWSNQAERDSDTLKEAELSNLNAPITHEAIINYYLYDKPIIETLWECKDIYKFCFTTKTGYTYDKTYYEYDGNFINANKINRVIATTDNKCGTIYKFKNIDEKLKLDERQSPYLFTDEKKHRKWVEKNKKDVYNFKKRTGLSYGRLDKIAEIPEHCKLMNDKLDYQKDLDLQWYLEFTENKIKELEVIE